MTKKIIGGIAVLVVLGLATFLLYLFVLKDRDSRPPAPGPAEQVAVRPSESPPEPATAPPGPSVPPEPVTPPSPEKAPPQVESGARPYAGPAPKPTGPPPEGKVAPQASLEPTEEHGLLAGRYRSFESAKKRLEKIKEQGLPAFIRKKGEYYEVWAGPFARPEEAEKAQKTLKAMRISAKKEKLIIPVPK
mgnify:FL=1